MRAAPRRSSSRCRLSTFSSRSRRLSSRLAARFATAVTTRRCSSWNGEGSAGPSRATQPAMRSRLGPALLNHSGAQSTDRTPPSSAATRGAMNAAWVRSTRSATAGSTATGGRPSIARTAARAHAGGWPSSRATRPRCAGTASRRWTSSDSRRISGDGVATTAAAARVSTPRIRLWRARAPASRPERVARSVTSRSRAPASASAGSEGAAASRKTRTQSDIPTWSPSWSGSSRCTRMPLRRVPLRLPRSRSTQPCGPWTISAWRRESSTSGRIRSHSCARPSTTRSPRRAKSSLGPFPDASRRCGTPSPSSRYQAIP